MLTVIRGGLGDYRVLNRMQGMYVVEQPFRAQHILRACVCMAAAVVLNIDQ